MKLTKPLNQIRSLLQHVASGGGYRLLSIIMAALLFCSTNSQVMAASMPIGANYAADSSASAISGDTFNAAALLKESAPSAGDDSLTFMQKLEIAGTALLLLGGGTAYAYRARYFDRLREGDFEGEGKGERSTSKLTQEERRVTSGEDNSAEGTSSLQERGEDGTAVIEEAPPSRWNASKAALASLGQKAWDFITLKDCREGGTLASKWDASKAALASLGQKALDFMTLRACRGEAVPAVAVAKSFSEHLNEVHAADQKEALAAQKARRTWSETVWDLLTLKQHALPDTRTAGQQELSAVDALKNTPHMELSFNQSAKLSKHIARERGFEAITIASSPDDMFAVLDPEMQEAVKAPLIKYASDDQTSLPPNNQTNLNKDKAQQFLYFVVKSHDSLTPGQLESLDRAFPVRSTDADGTVTQGNSELWNKLDDEIQALWERDRAKKSLQEMPLFNRLTM